MNSIEIFLYRFLGNCGPEWSGKASNEVIMGDEYSQTYGDLWTDSGTFFVVGKNIQNHRNVQGPKTVFVSFLKKNMCVETSTSYGPSGRSTKWQMIVH